MTHKHMGARSVEWYTPPSVFDALGIEFDLDPCSPLRGPVPWVPARRFYTAADDGLRQPWSGRVWLNPPYGRHNGKWLGKLAAHGDGIALVFVRSDTPWFQDAIRAADVSCLVRGRIPFLDPEGNTFRTPSPSVLFGFGSAADAVAACGLGVLVTPLRSSSSAV